MSELLQNLYDEYVKAVSQNSATIAQFESAFRLISYAIAGRFKDSTLLSELIYSATNLLVLFNDAIIKRGAGFFPSVGPSQERLQSLVTVLEYVAVFIEMAAQRFWGDVGRWIAIVLVQLAKAVSRFLLLTKHNVGIQTVPPLSPVDREAILKKMELSQSDEAVTSHPLSRNRDVPDVIFTLKRSGKVMRTLSKAPSIKQRDWKLPKDSGEGENSPQENSSPARGNHQPTVLTQSQTWAESIYILKPLIHLSSLSLFGTSSFKPWILSAGLDVGSLFLMGETADLNDNEKTELKRRAVMLLMYLMRSPFYKKHTEMRLLRILHSLADKVPGLSLVITPFIEYLPVWQQIYFYTWSS